MKNTMRFMSLISFALSGANSSSFLRERIPLHDHDDQPMRLRSEASPISRLAAFKRRLWTLPVEGQAQPQPQPQQPQPEAQPQLEAQPVKYDYYDCSPEIVSFDSVVFIEFNSDLTNLTVKERRSLEEAFQTTYNTLNMASCDLPYHRSIVNVTLEWPPRQRQRQHQRQRQLVQQLSDYQMTEISDYHWDDDDSSENTTNVPPNNTLNANGTTTTTTSSSTTTFSAAFQAVNADGSLSRPVETVATHIARFYVNIECHDCPRNSSLFAVRNLTTTTPFYLPTSQLLATIAQGRNREEELPSNNENVCACIRPDDSSPTTAATTITATTTTITPFRAPTSDEFQHALNKTVGSLRVAGVLQDVDEVEDLVEVDVVNCSSNVKQFTSNVFANLEGNPELMTDAERMALEQSFLETYNALTFARCDRYHRRIVQVRLISAHDRQRSLVEEDDDDGLDLDNYVLDMNATYNNGNATWFEYNNGTAFNSSFPIGNMTSANATANATNNNVVPAVYRVFGVCRNCLVSSSGSFNLFDETFRRTLKAVQRQKQQQSWFPVITNPSQQGGHRNLLELSDLSDVCICPANIEANVEPTAPTDKEFELEYSTNVEKLQQEGIVVHVNKVEDVSNDEDVCDEDLLEIIGEYVITFEGELRGPSSDDMVLVDAFRAAYRAFGRGVCGPILSSVKVVRSNNDRMKVTYAVESLQPLPGKIFFNIAEEKDFIASFNDFLEDFNSKVGAVSIAYASTPAPTFSPMKLTKVPEPVTTPVPSTANGTFTAREKEGSSGPPTTTKPSTTGPTTLGPSTLPPREGVSAPLGPTVPGTTQAPAIPNYELSDLAPPTTTRPTTQSPTLAPATVTSTIPGATMSPTTLMPANPDSVIDPSGGTTAPPATSPTDSISTAAPSTLMPLDQEVSDIVDDVGDTLKEIIGHALPIVEKIEEFLQEVDEVLENMIGSELPIVEGLSGMLEHIDDQIQKLSELPIPDIPGMPQTTENIRSNISDILGMLLGNSPPSTPTTTQVTTAAPATTTPAAGSDANPAVTQAPSIQHTSLPPTTLPPALSPTTLPPTETSKGSKGSGKGKTSTAAYVEGASTPSPTIRSSGVKGGKNPSGGDTSTSKGKSSKDQGSDSIWDNVLSWGLSSPTSSAPASPPTSTPTAIPTNAPTVEPTIEPTAEPTTFAPVLLLPSPHSVLSNGAGRGCMERWAEGGVFINTVCDWHVNQLWGYDAENKVLYAVSDEGITLCLEIDPQSAEGALRVSPCSLSLSQEWTQDGSSRYINDETGGCLDSEIAPGGTSLATVAVCADTPEQYFLLVDESSAGMLEQTPEPTLPPTFVPTTVYPLTNPPTITTTQETMITAELADPETPEPTDSPTAEPTDSPTPKPTNSPTPKPTNSPTPEPTDAPTPEPTDAPTPEPTDAPTPEPTDVPTPEPTEPPVTEPQGMNELGPFEP